MGSDRNYTLEKYRTAVYTLAGRGPLRDRLIDAYASSATRAYPPKSGMGPPVDSELLDQIQNLHMRLNAVDAVGDEGTISSTINAMTDEELDQVAEEIVSITFQLARACNDD